MYKSKIHSDSKKHLVFRVWPQYVQFMDDRRPSRSSKENKQLLGLYYDLTDCYNALLWGERESEGEREREREREIRQTNKKRKTDRKK